MKIVKLLDKEYVLKFNIGVLRRASKRLELKTPQLFEELSQNNIDVVFELIYQCISITHKDFDKDMLDELSMEEFTELAGALGEVISEGMPEPEKKTRKRAAKK